MIILLVSNLPADNGNFVIKTKMEMGILTYYWLN